MIQIEPSSLLFFFVASLLLIAAPGPDIVFLLTQGVTRGSRAGFATAMGLAAGNLVHTIWAVLGVSAVFQASAVAFHVLQIAGVSYLLYLAWRTVRGSGRAIDPEGRGPASAPEAHSGQGLFWRGFLMNSLNPKVALFFLAFLPQFATAETGPIWLQMLAYGVMFTLLVVLVFGTIGIVSGRLVRLSGATNPAAGRAVGWIVAGVYAALAFRLAITHR